MSPDLTLVQFTDPHITPSGKLMHDSVDTLAHLVAAVETVEDSGMDVAAFLLTGDLADNGHPESYERLRAVIEPAAARMGAKTIYVMGNHDERGAFRSGLLDVEPTTEPHDAVFMLGGVRIVVLDSSEPGKHDGHVTDAQLDWLADTLARPAPLGTVLVTHHPPIPSPVPTVNLLRMNDVDRLENVLLGTDVRLVVCGHAHHAGCGSIVGIPVWVGPALAYGVAPVPARDRLVARADAAFSRIDVFGDQIVATAVPLTGSATVYDVPEAERMAYIREVIGA
ncbi:metallophosphoesterase family protein [Actinokineospora sp. HUAS TT18]|uniref:metallophosphoesterase family protein n=1 Tax=Actinokineospora sp. HUAS TT18 TaxID=3447451 RepID=UPI003F51CC4F